MTNFSLFLFFQVILNAFIVDLPEISEAVLTYVNDCCKDLNRTKFGLTTLRGMFTCFVCAGLFHFSSFIVCCLFVCSFGCSLYVCFLVFFFKFFYFYFFFRKFIFIDIVITRPPYRQRCLEMLLEFCKYEGKRITK
jgi:hypothetical protein